jgi:transposase
MYDFHIGLDVSQKTTDLCAVDADGAVWAEGRVPTRPTQIAAWIAKHVGQDRKRIRIGLETGALTAWLYHELTAMGWQVLCLDALHAHRALSLQKNKTDRNDARALAGLVRMGPQWVKTVNVRRPENQVLRNTLQARTVLVEMRVKLENSICGLLKPLGEVVPRGQRSGATFARRVVAALERLRDKGHDLFAALLPLLRVHKDLIDRIKLYDQDMASIARAHPVARRLMTVPGVGPVTALHYVSVIDDPTRFRRSRDVGAYLGLTPKTYQSGERQWSGRISRHGNRVLRTALIQAATVMLCHTSSWSVLKSWGMRLVKRLGLLKARIAVARKLSVVLLRMWRTDTDFRFAVMPRA